MQLAWWHARRAGQASGNWIKQAPMHTAFAMTSAQCHRPCPESTTFLQAGLKGTQPWHNHALDMRTVLDPPSGQACFVAVTLEHGSPADMPEGVLEHQPMHDRPTTITLGSTQDIGQYPGACSSDTANQHGMTISSSP